MNSLNRKIRNKNPFTVQEGKFKFGRLADSSFRLSWTEYAFISDNKSREVVGRTFDFNRIKFILFFVILFLSIIICRVGYLQIIKGEYYYSMAEGNRVRVQNIEPNRGIVYDRNLKPMVRNVANFVLYFVPIDLPKNEIERNKLIKKISEILDAKNVANINSFDNSNSSGEIELLEESQTFADIKDKLQKVKIGSLESYQPLFIADNIEYEKAMFLYLESFDMPGVVLSNKTRREYLNEGNSSLSHILGYTGKINEKELQNFGSEYSQIDYIGKTGLEYFWENELKGSKGKKYIEVDALGNEVKLIDSLKAKDGYNLLLSLDTDLQAATEEILNRHLRKIGQRKASVIIMNPANGEILALISLPGFDNNIFTQGISQEQYQALLDDPANPLFNRSISGEFPSGSSIKPVVSVAALEEGIISENTSFYSTGGIRIGQWFFPDWKAGGHGLTNVRKAIAESVNTFFYYVGGGYEDFRGLGVDKIVDYDKLFGLGVQTGIDISGEADGFLPSKEWKEQTKKEMWYIGDTYHLAIGQGDILVTPLQVANFTAVFANGGTLYRPHLVKELVISNDKTIRKIEPEIIRQDFVDPYNITIVRQGMRQTVTRGSARSLQSLPVEVAGKTGTAQWSSQKNDHAWFTGFAPYKNPEIVVTILVEEGGEGSYVAVPIANEIMYWYFTHKPNN